MKYLLWLFLPILLLGQVRTVTQIGIKKTMIRGDLTTLTWTIPEDYSTDSLLFIAQSEGDPVLRLTTNDGLVASYTSPNTTITATIYAATTDDWVAQGYLYDITNVTDSVTLVMGLLTVIADNSNLTDTVVAPIPYYTVALDTPNVANTFIVGQDSNNTWYRKTPAQVQTILGIDTLSGGLIVDLDSLYTKTSHIVNVMDYVASYDTTGNWQPAIQAAIDAVKSSAGTRTGYGGTFGNTVAEVLLPIAYMRITEPINLYTGITLKGQGASSEIIEGAGFSGEQLINLTSSYTMGNYVDDAKILDVGLTTTTVRAIGCDTTANTIVNCVFENLTLNAVQGIILDTYAQFCIINNIYSWGSVDTLIYLIGNMNFIEKVDKEGYSGTATGSYIYLEKNSTDYSYGNVLRDILIEGVGSANKIAIDINHSKSITLENLWFETSARDDSVYINIDSCLDVRIIGQLQGIRPEGRIRISNSDVYVETINNYFYCNNCTFEDYFVLDDTSYLHIGNWNTKYGDNPLFLDSTKNIIIDKVMQTSNPIQAIIVPTGFSKVNRVQDISSDNLFINPSFEIGSYGWTIVTPPDSLTEFISSGVDNGLMLHLQWESIGAAQTGITYYQTFVPNVNWIGKTMTLSFKGKVVNGNGIYGTVLRPYVDGAGVEAGNWQSNILTGEGWRISSVTFRILTTDTLKIGFKSDGSYNNLSLFVDECTFSFGETSSFNSGNFGSIGINNSSLVYSSALPTTGTWKIGDRVYNSNPTEVRTTQNTYIVNGWTRITNGTNNDLNTDWVELKTVTSKTVYGIDFNGSDESVYDSTATFNFADSSFSIMFWVYIDTPLVNGARILSWRETGAYLDLHTTDSAYCRFDYAGSTDTTGFWFPISTSEWFLFTMVFNRDTELLGFYKNDSSVSIVGNPLTGLGSMTNTSPLFLGRYAVTDTNYSQIKLGELLIMNNYAVTQADRSDAYNNEVFKLYGGTPLLWIDWGGSSTAIMLNDYSGYNNDLTGTNVNQAGDQVIINGGYK